MSEQPWLLPLSFDFTGIAGAFVELGEGEIQRVTSHCEDGKNLLISQFRKPRVEAMLCAFLEEVQDFDDAAWRVLTERGLGNAVGVQLDNIGDLLQLQRRGWGDDTYRLLLGVQVLTLRSEGTWPDIAGILEALALDLSAAEFRDSDIATAIIVLGEVLDGVVSADDAFEFLRRAKQGGVRLDLEHPTIAVDQALTWADGDVAQADTLRGWADDTPTTNGGYWADVVSTQDQA